MENEYYKRTQTNATRRHRTAISRNCVLVQCNVDDFQYSATLSVMKVTNHRLRSKQHCLILPLGLGSIDSFVAEVDQQKVVISAARHHRVVGRSKRRGKRLSVLQNLLLVLNKLRRLSLLQRHCKSRYGVVVRTALVPRKNRLIDR